MDETRNSRKSDAAATRKRRSSILKSQRAPRTPLSELEFNVATPTDTAKSRRVSFSRRTGVAEFATNEATTTWKNVYEEHNKSLESSGNESGAHAQREPLGHIGKRVFEQQFEEVEAVDFISTLNTGPMAFNCSVQNNFSEQIAALESTSDLKLQPPASRFEVSALTEQSKLFGNDLAAPNVEMSGRIDVNFSALHTIENDDLDMIQKDLQRAHNSVVCHGPFSERNNLSEYIEVDLNTTHVTMGNHESDMSITDTINSPKVQDVSKSVSIDKKVNLNKDWVMDKENIVVNPYAAPREATNFALNKEPDKVLVFDGKRLTIQTNTNLSKTASFHETSSNRSTQRKTIVLNVNDDLPNFSDDPHDGKGHISMAELKKGVIYDEEDMSMTQTANKSEVNAKRRTIHYEDDAGNISVTQAVSSDIIMGDKEKRRTIVFDNDSGDISMTQALPANIMADAKNTDKRRTIVYESDSGNISITQAVPSNIIMPDKDPGKRRTILFENDGNISITQALPPNIMTENPFVIQDKRRTILLDNEPSISVTQDIPTNVISSKEVIPETKRRTIMFGNDKENTSVLQCFPGNVAVPQMHSPEKKRIIVFENDTGNISITQTLPVSNIPSEAAKRKTIVYDNDTGNISVTQALPTRILPHHVNQRTIFDDLTDLSMTHAVPTDVKQVVNEKRRTIVYDNDSGNISVTQALPTNIVATEMPTLNKGVEESVDSMDMSVTKAIASKIILAKDPNESIEKLIATLPKMSQTDVIPEIIVQDNCNASMTQGINKIIPVIEPSRDVIKSNIENINKRKTVVFDNDEADISMTQAIPTNIICDKPIETKIASLKKSEQDDSITNMLLDMKDKDSVDKPNVISEVVLNNDLNKTNCKRKTIDFDKIDMAVIEALHTSNAKEDRTIIADDLGNLSICKNVSHKEYDIDSIKTINNGPAEVSRGILVYQTTTNTDSHALPLGDNIQDTKRDSIEFVSSTSTIEKSISKDSNATKDTGMQHIKEQENDEPMGATKESATSVENEMYDVHTEPTHEKPSVQGILNELLDMSGSAEGGIDDKALMATIEPEPTPAEDEQKSSNESLFFITRDTDNEAQTDKSATAHEKPEIDELKKKLDILKKDTANSASSGSSCPQKNRHYEKILSSNLENIAEKDISHQSPTHESVAIQRPINRSFQNANDTNELLEMLSDFTDKTLRNKSACAVDDVKQPIMIKGHLALEDKSNDQIEPRRMSYGTKRQSIINREDLLNNISMAQAALQQDRELDETDLADTTKDTTIDKPKKAVRLSSEVVKTLQFDDSVSEMSLASDKISPLKKTAFGETSYMKESKTRVIPSYLKDVSDGIKALMSDLVKPLADVLPFESVGSDPKKSPSTCSTQIQANLVASSQIDLDVEFRSNPESIHDIPKPILRKGPIDDDSDSPSPSHVMFQMPRRQSVHYPDRVLIFDHNNPLNNVLLNPIKYSEAHKYDPASREVLQRSKSDLQSKDFEVERVSVQFHLEGQRRPSGDGSYGETKSVTSNMGTRPSVDQSIDTKFNELKDNEANTYIAMKGNKELLAASSSLTLVDDAITCSVFDVDIESRTTTNTPGIKVIYKTDEKSDRMESDCTPSEDTSEKPKKRIYSPTRRDKHKACTLSSSDVTPKQLAKMQKVSRSPSLNPDQLAPEKDARPKQAQKKMKKKKPAANITVQQLITEYNITKEDQTALNRQILAALNSDSSVEPKTTDVEEVPSLELVSSFTSSKNLQEDSVASMSSEWTAEMASDVDVTGGNVVAKIDMLPFMGSHECEWEPSAGDTWSFRLLLGRLRLRARLAHTHHNAPRSCVRPDTRLLHVALHTQHYDKKNSVAAMCVSLAAEAMRRELEGCARAGDVPALLRRCAGVARLAARWGRAMHEARARLAANIHDDNVITLKVANIPLRSVWEVSLRVELCGAAHGPAYPRAGEVRVARVVSDVRVRADHTRRVLDAVPADWGHVPRTLWRIFKFLKNLTPESGTIELT